MLNIDGDTLASNVGLSIFDEYANRLAFKVDEKWGVADGKGSLVKAPEYDEIVFLTCFLSEARRLFPMLDPQTQLNAETPTRAAQYFKFRQNGYWGLADPNGNILLEPEFTEIECELKADRIVFDFFTRPVVRVSSHQTRQEAVSVARRHFDKLRKYDEFKPMLLKRDDGIVRFRDGEKWGAMDSSGAVILKPKYNAIGRVSDDHLIISSLEKDKRYFGLANLRGREVVPMVYPEIDALSIEKGTFLAQNKDGRYGVIDTLNNILIPFQYLPIQRVGEENPYRDHYRNRYLLSAIIAVGSQWYRAHGENGYAVYDSSFKERWPANLEQVRFSDHRGPTPRVRQANQWGLIDLAAGKYILPCAYEETGKRSHGLMTWQKDSKWAFSDTNGVFLQDFMYDELEDYDCTCCPDIRFTRARIGEKWGLLMNGKEVLSYQYAEIREVYGNGLVEVRRDSAGPLLLIDKETGKAVSEEGFEEVAALAGDLAGQYGKPGDETAPLGDLYVAVRKGGKWGLASPAGLDAACVWNEVKLLGTRNFAARRGAQWQILNAAGKPLLEAWFSEIRGTK